MPLISIRNDTYNALKEYSKTTGKSMSQIVYDAILSMNDIDDVDILIEQDTIQNNPNPKPKIRIPRPILTPEQRQQKINYYRYVRKYKFKDEWVDEYGSLHIPRNSDVSRKEDEYAEMFRGLPTI